MKKIRNYHIAGCIFTLIAGTLLHFVYDWSGKSCCAAVFSAVNESTWEHLKLLFVPAIVFAVIEYFAYGKERPNFLPAKAISISAGLAAIVSLFYTYSGIIGKNYAAIDILIFVLSVCLTYAISFRILESEKFGTKKALVLSICVLAILIVMFSVFTFYPPHIGLFEDPIYGGYGIR